jgi:hypothetical protein
MNLQASKLIALTIVLNLMACKPALQPVQTPIPKGSTVYNTIATPTVFAKPPQTIPSVKLNWVYADPKLFKFDMTITGLDSNANIDDLVCNPYMNIKEPISYGSGGERDVNRLTGQQGNPVELTYIYVLDPPIQYKSLDVDMLVTLGPCAEYLNAQESNVTPTFIPPLIANYHFVFQVPVQQ